MGFERFCKQFLLFLQICIPIDHVSELRSFRHHMMKFYEDISSSR